MRERFREHKYTITYNIADLGPEFNFSPELMDILSEYGQKIFVEGKHGELIPDLVSLVVKYPHAAILKNYLSMAYFNSGQPEKAREVNDWIIKEHPEYLYGIINKAFDELTKGHYDKIPSMLANLTDIQDMYPDRKVFHIQEVISFHKIAACYFAATGNMEEALNRAELLEELDTNGNDYNFVADFINNIQKQGHYPVIQSKGYDKHRQIDTPPKFKNASVHNLYKYEVDIPAKVIRQILKADRVSIIADLEAVIEDTIVRYEYYADRLDNGDIDLHETFMAVHAIALLGELRSTGSLPIVLDFLRQGDEFLDFWVGELLTDDMWVFIARIAGDNFEALKDFILEANIYPVSKMVAAEAVKNYALLYPELRDKAVEFASHLLQDAEDTLGDDEIAGEAVLSILIEILINLRRTEFLPLIKEIYEDFPEIDDFYPLKEAIRDINKKRIAKPLHSELSVEEFYIKVQYLNQLMGEVSNMFGEEDEVEDENHEYRSGPYDQEEEEEDWDEEDFMEDLYGRKKHSDVSPGRIIPFPNQPSNLGRNDQCHCGSGKKYKDCCWKKDHGFED